MKEINIESDINLVCVRAKKFPEGIEDAFKILTNKFEYSEEKGCYGIYEETDEEIVYRAAMQVDSDSESTLDKFEKFTIEKGKYLSTIITEWQEKIDLIGPTFDKLFQDERVDKNSVSIEMYKGTNELTCMVKII